MKKLRKIAKDRDVTCVQCHREFRRVNYATETYACDYPDCPNYALLAFSKEDMFDMIIPQKNDLK